ncbi:MAG TPA: M23 family metallopeptidase [Gemmatimonadales bacterium]|jgi:murein DD-endopeptidase MepM/ murein hydrolase activator NlpD
MSLLLLATALLVQDISWQPATPRQGSLIVVSAPDAIAGRLAGEPLHFRRGTALAAVPLSTTDSTRLETLSIRWDGAVVGETVYVPVEMRRAAEEQVQAAERFTPPPDSALQVRIDRERALLRDAARRAHDVPRLWKARFIRPRTARITSPFGSGRQVNGVWRSRHSGLDIAGRNGAPVRAANRGIVALVGDFFYGGISVFVHHGDGVMTVYHHLSRALVAAGDTVERAQIIGRVGATGRVTGPHLHWQAQYGAVAFDPADLLKLP